MSANVAAPSGARRSPAPRPGGRTARTRVAVLDAARALLAEGGPAALTWEALAERSGVHRTTIYRRWGTISGVVADLAEQYDAAGVVPDTGTLAGDLEGLAAWLSAQLTPQGGRMLAALLAWDDPSVRGALDGFWARRRADVRVVLDRHGVHADPALVLRLAAGPLYYAALVERRQPGRGDVAAAVRSALAVLTPEAAGPSLDGS